jgi:hypothetical protein
LCFVFFFFKEIRCFFRLAKKFGSHWDAGVAAMIADDVKYAERTIAPTEPMPVAPKRKLVEMTKGDLNSQAIKRQADHEYKAAMQVFKKARRTWQRRTDGVNKVSARQARLAQENGRECNWSYEYLMSS